MNSKVINKYYCYILWSEKGQKYYIGATTDLETRIKNHNLGRSLWTKRFAGSWQLIWQREVSSYFEARKLENFLKRQKGGDVFFEYTGLKPLGS